MSASEESAVLEKVQGGRLRSQMPGLSSWSRKGAVSPSGCAHTRGLGDWGDGWASVGAGLPELPGSCRGSRSGSESWGWNCRLPRVPVGTEEAHLCRELSGREGRVDHVGGFAVLPT